MGKKRHISPISLLAGGAALTTVAVVLAPVMLRVGYRTIRKYAERYEFDLETGTIRRKDRDVVMLTQEEYEISER